MGDPVGRRQLAGGPLVGVLGAPGAGDSSLRRSLTDDALPSRRTCVRHTRSGIAYAIPPRHVVGARASLHFRHESLPVRARIPFHAQES